ncbi:uncharacterized protein LOC109861720 [Pseudomyrmex gracilis]|uniref:uncharacterized protein LOC109861720 n=1 Tax=Pseudomyrmex gracilis TaxID=219809 RepID=UPI0009957555|nr:uncharacterized protein LOC109861720 [Pseudomyrmex gracilis]
MKSGLMKKSFLGFLILILTTMDQTMMASHHSRHHRVSRRTHLSNAMQASRQFPCSEPQTRAYHLRDLVQNLRPSESANQPAYIVLKRCDSHSGCCHSPDLSCTPVQSEIHYEEIQIEVWSLQTNSKRKMWIQVEQHGNCTCEISNSTQRLEMDSQQPNIQIPSS